MDKIGGLDRMQSRQWLAALAASVATINVGNAEFWILRTINNTKSSDPASQNNEHFVWVALFLGFTSIVIGAILGAVLADKIGRRRTLSMTGILTISQIVSSFTTNGVLSCLALFLGLIGLGMTRVVVPLFISEIVDDNIRGTLLMLQLPFFYFGKLIAVGISQIVTAEIIGVVSLILTSIFLISFTRLPETPYYLASKKRNDAATESLAFYRGTQRLAGENEIDEIMKNDSEECRGRIHALVRLTNFKGLAIVMFLIIVKWSDEILDTKNDMLHIVIVLVSSEYYAKIISHVITLLISLLIVFTIDVIGRRSFLLYSNFVGFIVVIICLVLIITVTHVDGWVDCVIGIILHLCELIFFSVSLVYVGELFSSNVKALAIAILTTVDLLTSLVIILMAEFMAVDISSRIGGILLLVAFPLTFIFIPETKRKSFSDIQSELSTTFHCKWLIEKLTRANVN